MTVNAPFVERDATMTIAAWIRERLPESWSVDWSLPLASTAHRPEHGDAVLELRGPDGSSAALLLDLNKSFGPRDVDRLQSGIGRTLRRLAGDIPIVVVAPWLSDRTQERLRAAGIDYVDLTGNARVRLEQPTLYLETRGAARDPAPRPRSKARVQGPKAGRLTRMLVDVRPPYGVRELAGATGLSPGYVSRLLETLDEQALVERRRGEVVDVDVSGLIWQWSQSYDLFRSNVLATFIAPPGAARALDLLPTLPVRTAVTGSFAAVRRAAVAPPALLAVYTDSPALVAKTLDLYPADEGVNVVLMSPYDPVVWDRVWIDRGLTYVALSQVAVDCLTGNGRMPNEGDALLRWMSEHESDWRVASLPAGPLDGPDESD